VVVVVVVVVVIEVELKVQVKAAITVQKLVFFYWHMDRDTLSGPTFRLWVKRKSAGYN
jgi:hypothetical protein